jgi:hypothetical protein
MPFDGVIGSYQPRFAWVSKFGRKLKVAFLQSPDLRAARLAHQSLTVLDLLERRLGGGNNWTQGCYQYGKNTAWLGL